MRFWPNRRRQDRVSAFLLLSPLALVSSYTSPALASQVALVLRGDGAGAARFGQSEPMATKALDEALSSTKRAVVNMAGNCTVDRAVQWPTFTAYFDRDRFVGYSTLAADGEPLRNAPMVTAKGLRVGDTLAEARRIYGDTLSTTLAQGGAWFAKTDDGTLDGYLTAEVNSRVPAPRIASIEAGHVGCPAASP
jgi:hypothetical protein